MNVFERVSISCELFVCIFSTASCVLFALDGSSGLAGVIWPLIALIQTLKLLEERYSL